MAPSFGAVGIGYGRADYAVVDGRPQISEINAKPMVERPEEQPSTTRAPAEIVLARWLEALAAFSPPRKRGQVAEWIAMSGAARRASAPAGFLIQRAIRPLVAATGQAAS